MEVRRWALRAVDGRLPKIAHCEVEVRPRTRMSVQTTTYQLLVTVDVPRSMDASLLDLVDRCIQRELRHAAWPHVEFELYLRLRRIGGADGVDPHAGAWADTVPATLE